MAKSQPRTPSSDELDYQRRLDENFASDKLSTSGEPVEVYAPYAVEGNDTSAYVGVSPEYMTYASETEKPHRAESGVEAKREARVFDAAPIVAIPEASVLDEDTATAGGGASSDLVYTAHSGENYSAKMAEKPAEEEPEESDESEEPVVAPPVAPPATQTPVVSTGSSN